MFHVFRSGESDFQYYNDILEALMMVQMETEDKAGPEFGVTTSLTHSVFTNPELEPRANITVYIVNKSNPENKSRTSIDLLNGEQYETEPLTALVEHAIHNTNQLMDDAIMMDGPLEDSTVSDNVSKIIRENLTLAGVADRFAISCHLKNHQISFVTLTVK
jgi:hypothetical protein